MIAQWHAVGIATRLAKNIGCAECAGAFAHTHTHTHTRTHAHSPAPAAARLPRRCPLARWCAHGQLPLSSCCHGLVGAAQCCAVLRSAAHEAVHGRKHTLRSWCSRTGAGDRCMLIVRIGAVITWTFLEGHMREHVLLLLPLLLLLLLLLLPLLRGAGGGGFNSRPSTCTPRASYHAPRTAVAVAAWCVRAPSPRAVTVADIPSRRSPVTFCARGGGPHLSVAASTPTATT
jgi:hypothetical protein